MTSYFPVYFEACWGAFLFAIPGLVFALATFPMFERLVSPQVAWALARAAGPALVTFLNLMPAVFGQGVPFNGMSLGFSALVLGFAAWSTREKKKPFPLADAKRCEAVFWGVLFGAVLFVPFMASMNGMGERMRDTAIWHGLLVQKHFPLEDPWLAGKTLFYYGFGYYSLASLALFTPLSPLASYNVALAWVFSTYLASLVALFRELEFSPRRAVLSALGVACASNLKALRQAFEALGGTHYNWWDPSRAIVDTITEFPLWTFSLGDLHPHYLMLPLVVWLLTLWLHSVREGIRPLTAAAAGVLLGWMWGGNTWEFPIGFGFCFAALSLKFTAPTSWRGFWDGIRSERKAFAVLVGVTALSALIFWPQLAPRGRSFGFVSERSAATELLLAWGLYLVPLLLIALRRPELAPWRIGLVLFGVLAVGLNSALVFCLMTIFLFWNSWRNDEDSRTLWAVALFGVGVITACELFHLRDVYGDKLARMNTVFKFYMPAWTLVGVAAVGIVGSRVGRPWLVLWGLGLGAHLTFGLHSRSGAFQSVAPLDGMREVENSSRDDAALARWMQENRPKGILLEAPGGAYSLHGRFASATGARGFVAWEGYGFWPIGGVEKEAGDRFQLTKAFFTTERTPASLPCETVVDTLRKAKIENVVLGALERKVLSRETASKIESCLTVVHREGEAILLAVPGGVSESASSGLPRP